MGNLVFQATLGGQVNLVGPNTASTYNINVPTVNSTLATLAAQTFAGTQTISSGNLVFSGTSQFVSGDFSNATLLSRTAFQTSTTNGSTGIYALPNGTSTAASWQATNAADPTNASKILIATNGSTDVQLVSGINGTGTYLPLTFYTNGAEKMRLDTSGNLGLGVTPSAWNLSGFSALQVKNASLGGYLNRNYLSANTYHNGTNWTYIATDTAGQYSINTNGQHQWYIAPSGTAGTAITWTQAMTLDASGNLGVGATSITSLGSGYQTTQLQGTNGSGLLFYRGSSTQIGYFYGDSTGMSWGTSSAIPLMFLTNGTERARINSSGNLSVGSTASDGRVYIKGVDSTSSNYALNVENSNGNTMLRIRNDYQAVIYGAYNSTTASAANVNVDSTGVLARSTSALKYKQDIRDLEEIDINKFRPVRYKSKCENDDQTKDHFGVIADEVAAAGIEELVTRGSDGDVEGFQYERLTVVLLKTIQEQQALITQLQADVAALKGQA